MLKAPLLQYEEIFSVLEALGQGTEGNVSTHKAESITIEQLKNPTPEVASIVYQRLVNCSNVNGSQKRVPAFSYPHLFMEAHQQQTVIKGAKTLARMHQENFGVDDIAHADPKRMRRLLSIFINYCRFENDFEAGCDEMLQQKRQKVGILEDLRNRITTIETDVDMARERNEDEEAHLHEIMKACQQAESLENEKASKKREVDEQARKADLRLADLQNKIQAQVQKRESLLEMKEELKMQVAESPETIQASIEDLDASSARKRAQKEEKNNEKQMRATRMRDLEKYRKEVETHIGKAKELSKKDERLSKEKVVLKEHTDKLERLKGKYESVQEESKRLESEVNELVAQQNEDTQDHQSRMADLCDTLKEAQRKYSEEESMRDGLMNEDSKKRRERDELLAEISSVKDSEQIRINEMRDELEKLQKAAQDYKIKVHQIFGKQKSGALGGA